MVVLLHHREVYSNLKSISSSIVFFNLATKSAACILRLGIVVWRKGATLVLPIRNWIVVSWFPVVLMYDTAAVASNDASLKTVPLSSQVLYHLPYLTVPLPVPDPGWPFHCLLWLLRPIPIHVSIFLAVESWLGRGQEIWLSKDRNNLTQMTEDCVVFHIFLSKFFLSFALNIKLSSSYLWWTSSNLCWKLFLKSSSTGLHRSPCISWHPWP